MDKLNSHSKYAIKNWSKFYVTKFEFNQLTEASQLIHEYRIKLKNHDIHIGGLCVMHGNMAVIQISQTSTNVFRVG